jgi:hypothetical protein
MFESGVLSGIFGSQKNSDRRMERPAWKKVQ